MRESSIVGKVAAAAVATRPERRPGRVMKAAEDTAKERVPTLEAKTK